MLLWGSGNDSGKDSAKDPGTDSGKACCRVRLEMLVGALVRMLLRILVGMLLRIPARPLAGMLAGCGWAGRGSRELVAPSGAGESEHTSA